MKLKILFFVILFNLIFIFVGLIKFTSEVVAYDFKNDSGLNATAQNSGHLNDNQPIISDDLQTVVVGKIIQTFLSFLGVIFFGLMLYGGYCWMLARGNEQDVEKAKNIITNAIIGLVIVLAAYAITAFVGAWLVKGAVQK